MRKKRNTCGGKYYPISNPYERNAKSGNFVVSEKYLLAHDKDFLFEWKNPDTNEIEIKVLSKEYVVQHIKKIPHWLEDELLGKKTIHGMFWMISYKDICDY